MNLNIAKFLSFSAETCKAQKWPIFSIHDMGKSDPWLPSPYLNYTERWKSGSLQYL